MGAGSHTGSEEGCNPDGTGIDIGAARLAVKDELDHREFWSGRWESNCIPNPKALCFDGVAAPFRFKWSQVESNSLCWLGSAPLPDCELVGPSRRFSNLDSALSRSSP